MDGSSRKATEKCLICCSKLTETGSESDPHLAPILLKIFGELCQCLNVKFPSKLSKWDFSTEVFPFCQSCRKEVVKLCNLQNELTRIKRLIDNTVAKLIVRVLESPELAADEDKAPAPWLKKYQYFRIFVKRRFDARVKLRDCKQECKPRTKKTAKTLPSLEPISAGNKKELTERRDSKDEESKDEESELCGMIRLKPLSLLTDEVDQTGGDSLETETNHDNLEREPPDAMDVERSGAVVQLGERAEVQQAPAVGETYVELPQLSFGDFYDEGMLELAGDVQDDPFQLPACDVVLEEPEIDFGYLMPNPSKLPVSIVPPQPVPLVPVTTHAVMAQGTSSLPQPSAPPLKSTVPATAQHRAPTWNPPKTITPAQAPKLPYYGGRQIKNRKEVILVDEATNTYSYGGHKFIKRDGRCRCKTCGAWLKLRQNADHYVNIRNHINAVHIEKRSSSQAQPNTITSDIIEID